jgi:hypothetical protein
MAIVLKADHFRKGSFATEMGCPRNVRYSPDSDRCLRREHIMPQHPAINPS